MFKIDKDLMLNKISFEDFQNPGIIASYALEDPKYFAELLKCYRELNIDIPDEPQGLIRDELIFMAGIFRDAINIVEVNLGVRGESPHVTK